MFNISPWTLRIAVTQPLAGGLSDLVEGGGSHRLNGGSLGEAAQIKSQIGRSNTGLSCGSGCEWEGPDGRLQY